MILYLMLCLYSCIQFKFCDNIIHNYMIYMTYLNSIWSKYETHFTNGLWNVLLMSYRYKMKLLLLLFTCWSCLHLSRKPMRKQLQANVHLKAKLVSVNGFITSLLGKLFIKLSRNILEVTLFAMYSPKNNQSFPCLQCSHLVT